MKHRFHVLSLPHTQTTAEFVSCAYTQKVRKFGKMMTDLGHEVFIYSGEENDAACTEHVTVVTKDQQREWFGEYDMGQMYPITWGVDDVHWRESNFRACQEIRKRAEPQDFVLIIAGVCQEQVAKDLSHLVSCEWGIGYQGIFSDRCAFESYAWRHWIYGQRGWDNGRWFDAVIPNFFDLDEFPNHEVREDDPYLLYVGRLIQRKGVNVAVQVAEQVGLPLVIAGQGARDWGPGFVQADELRIEGNIRYVGTVGVEERAELMGGAKALLCPTVYIEPFGGVAVEAMLAGCPAVATDWGAFTETVEEGLTGARFKTLGGGREAVERAMDLDRGVVRNRAASRYSLEAVGAMYQEWFDQLRTLWGEGWNDIRGPRELALAGSVR